MSPVSEGWTPPALPPPVRIPTNGIELSVHVAGTDDGPAVVLAHGFPDLAFSWRHQVPTLLGAGYRAIVPDMRGYGGSDRPEDVAGYDSATVGADLIGLLDALEVDRAVFVGHDWGASSVWPLTFSHPERVRGIAGLSVPFAPAAPVSPLSIMERRLGPEFYMLRFQPQGSPESALGRDITATLLAIFSDLGPFDAPPHATPPSWLSAAELSVYVETFTRTGFSTALNYYRNIERNWQAARRVAGHTTALPALFVTGDRDAVASFMPADRMHEAFSDLRTETVHGAGHWLHQQQPKQINRLLLAFLDQLPA
jgi:pimeloyl-ACP methyl ester carboxylesterase